VSREVFHEDGKPDLRPWANELDTDYHCILSKVREMLIHNEEPTAHTFAYMRKEARRMVSDIERMAAHAGFSRDDLDNVGPL
jgi:hypothetical protein